MSVSIKNSVSGGGGIVSSDEVTAIAGDVLKGKTYLGNDTNDSIGTGTLELTGSLEPTFAFKGTTFYSSNPKIKQTGLIGNSTLNEFYRQYNPGEKSVSYTIPQGSINKLIFIHAGCNNKRCYKLISAENTIESCSPVLIANHIADARSFHLWVLLAKAGTRIEVSVSDLTPDATIDYLEIRALWV